MKQLIWLCYEHHQAPRFFRLLCSFRKASMQKASSVTAADSATGHARRLLQVGLRLSHRRDMPAMPQRRDSKFLKPCTADQVAA